MVLFYSKKSIFENFYKLDKCNISGEGVSRRGGDYGVNMGSSSGRGWVMEACRGPL